MSTAESDAPLLKGFCFLCNSEIDDLKEHVEGAHQPRVSKPRVSMLSWAHRMDKIVQSLTEIRTEPDPGTQIDRLDAEVIQELYLVRQDLTLKKKGS